MVEAIKYFFKEHIENRRYIYKLAKSKAKQDTEKTTLGMYWNVVRDAVFFATYALFITVMRGKNTGGVMEGQLMLAYLFTGLVAWYLISDFLNSGVKCIMNNKNIFTKIKFPILLLPTIETIAIFIKRISTFVMLIVLLGALAITQGYRPNINIITLVYFGVAIFAFGVSYCLLMSGFYTISKDFRELYKAIVRVQFYFVPIFWSIEDIVMKSHKVPEWIGPILENMPFIHLVNTFRKAINLGTFPPMSEVLIFSGIVVVMFSLGCYIQYKLRRIYADFV
ncbi:MAG: hypothetical protein RR543_02390 [Erysipelotrichales bacterium]